MNYETIQQKNVNLQRDYNENFTKLKYCSIQKKDVINSITKKETSYAFIQHEKQNNFIKTNAEDIIKTHIPNSFFLQVSFSLLSPFFSKEDDEMYYLTNPCVKDKAFKIPLLRASSLKGAIAKSAREIINKDNKDNKNKLDYIKAYFRIFGVGDEEFRNLYEESNELVNDLKLFFMKNGISIKVEQQDINTLFSKYKKNKAQKGRVVFYPVFFDKFSLEVINPHDKKRKVGSRPIYYEVVPKETISSINLIYIPFDGILEPDKEVQKEAKFDAKFLEECIKQTLNNGLGAKTKLGWGRGKIQENGICQEWSSK